MVRIHADRKKKHSFEDYRTLDLADIDGASAEMSRLVSEKKVQPDVKNPSPTFAKNRRGSAGTAEASKGKALSGVGEMNHAAARGRRRSAEMILERKGSQGAEYHNDINEVLASLNLIEVPSNASQNEPKSRKPAPSTVLGRARRRSYDRATSNTSSVSPFKPDAHRSPGAYLSPSKSPNKRNVWHEEEEEAETTVPSNPVMLLPPSLVNARQVQTEQRRIEKSTEQRHRELNDAHHGRYDSVYADLERKLEAKLGV